MVNKWQTMCCKGEWQGQAFNYWFARPNPEIFDAVAVISGDGSLPPGQNPRKVTGKAFIPILDDQAQAEIGMFT